jgi:beta-mannosidase
MARVRSVGGTRVVPIATGWQMASTAAGRIPNPDALEPERLDWCQASVPSTAASALREASRWTLDDRVDFDASDWWWRCRFGASPADGSARVLRLGGLATLGEVWLNGTSILRSDNMFIDHELRVDALLREDNQLVVCCRSLGEALRARRPRPRWRTRLVEAQQLRWFRTTLLGRIPAWTPPTAVVGPWRPIVLEERARIATLRADVRPRLDGDDGIVDTRIVLATTHGQGPEEVLLRAGDSAGTLTCRAGDDGQTIAEGAIRLRGVTRWWPHTHGTPHRVSVRAEVMIAGEVVEVDLGAAGFRTIEVDHRGDGFALRVNGVDVFCRGVCWTPLDSTGRTPAAPAYRAALEAVRDAGMNMVRVCGPFFYEDDAFYDACDEMGILVWQDYAFANMDYPDVDPAFVASVEREATGFLDRTGLSCSVTVLCGNSEVEQQAAMMGAPRELWRAPLFARTLADVSRRLRPDLPYWPSTPSGGALPFANDNGTAHYFGVGAYLRPLDDARRSQVRFATECLAFANVPDQRAVDELMMAGGVPPQDARWKRRTPRDGGAAWDFEDVRDHYLGALFRVDPLALRYSDGLRYLALSRVVTGEVMAATFAEWRRLGSSCRGGLVWFLRDLWQGAGWGVLDADGRPKVAYHYLRRALKPVAVAFADEGLNGLDVHVVNDTASNLVAELRLALLRGGEVPVASARATVDVGARGVSRSRVAGLLEHFIDTTYAYRFGPPAYDVAVATLVDSSNGTVLSEAFHFPAGLPSGVEQDVGLAATSTPIDGGAFKLSLRTRRFAQSVELDVDGFDPDDNYFHVAPGNPREVLLRPRGHASSPKGTAHPLNAQTTSKIVATSASTGE